MILRRVLLEQFDLLRFICCVESTRPERQIVVKKFGFCACALSSAGIKATCQGALKPAPAFPRRRLRSLVSRQDRMLRCGCRRRNSRARRGFSNRQNAFDARLRRGQILSAAPARIQAPAGRAHLLLRSCLDQVRIGSRNCHAECVNFSGQQPSIESGPSSPFPFWLLPSIRRRRSRPIRSIDYRRGPAASERPGRAQRRLVVSIQGSSSRLYHEPMDRTN